MHEVQHVADCVHFMLPVQRTTRVIINSTGAELQECCLTHNHLSNSGRLKMVALLKNIGTRALAVRHVYISSQVGEVGQ
jgi:molybdopterin biosynthesis enzyme